ncbi:hypothetical protein CMU19_11970 [Elizabethkingia anophelis]|nr:hypothetical protein [Elizabethkingia anophelis]
MLLFNGCRTNDEAIKNERQIQGAEYSSKTLWNEDEKYIKNVIKVYDQYKETVGKSTQIKGEPFWDYAMTMGQFNESYLEVPIINQEKVVQILRVIRKGSKVYFSSNSTEKTSLDFFQQLIFGKYTTIKGKEEHKGKIQNAGAGSIAMGQVVCVTRTVSMWYPDNNNDPDGPGHWESMSETRCTWVEQVTDTIVPCIDCSDGGLPEGPGGVGLPYIDAATEIDIEQLKNYPCAYAISQELTTLNNELASIMNKIFKNSDKYRITFKAGTLPDSKDGETKTLPKKEVDKFFATITLNEKMLSSATKEYILITMYHEVIHAYLGYELMQLGTTKFQEKYPMYLFYNDYDSSGNVIRRFTFKEDHNEFGIFMDTLTNVVTSYNSSKSPNNMLSSETIKALVKGGVTSLNSAESDINEREKGFNTQKYGTPNGTKCP